MSLLISLVPLIIYLRLVSAFDSDQLEVFDVVEEVKENFYTLLNISKDATIQEIKSAFRSLSLKLHPDKNLDVDTSVQFRNLVSVYDILRNSAKRKYYDEVLTNGLPNWRSAVYYYRYVRKMGMIEVCIILFVIITIGQYLVNWAAYLEKKYTIEQNRKVKRKRSDKVEPEVELPRPSMVNTLPVQIPWLIWYTIISIPSLLRATKSVIEEATAAPPPPPVEEPPVPRVKTIRKRNKGFTLPEGPNFETTKATEDYQESIAPPPVASGGLWTDEDLAELTRLVKKYPGGTTGRWEIIAEFMMRSVPEITYMANKIKENIYKLQNEETQPEVEIKIKKKTKKDVVVDDSKKWNQIQQKTLEDAIAKFPKGCLDRWDRIAEAVPNKTKEECMLRFKFLAETLKKQKSAIVNQPPQTDDSSDKME